MQRKEIQKETQPLGHQQIFKLLSRIQLGWTSDLWCFGKQFYDILVLFRDFWNVLLRVRSLVMADLSLLWRSVDMSRLDPGLQRLQLKIQRLVGLFRFRVFSTSLLCIFSKSPILSDILTFREVLDNLCSWLSFNKLSMIQNYISNLNTWRQVVIKGITTITVINSILGYNVTEKSRYLQSFSNFSRNIIWKLNEIAFA